MQKDLLWKAAILTVIVFLAGLFLGAWLDISRVGAVKSRLVELELQWNDARLQSLYYQQLTNDIGCNAAVYANLKFNEKIYEEGKKIEQYELVNRFAPELIKEKQKYALLQLQFWLNSITLRKKCNTSYTTIVYFYSHYNESAAMDQKLQSAVLLELKEQYGNKILLIPLPTDLGVSTIELIKKIYNITSTPAILINESKLLVGVQSLDKIKSELE